MHCTKSVSRHATIVWTHRDHHTKYDTTAPNSCAVAQISSHSEASRSGIARRNHSIHSSLCIIDQNLEFYIHIHTHLMVETNEHIERTCKMNIMM